MAAAELRFTMHEEGVKGIAVIENLIGLGAKPNIMVPVESPISYIYWNGKPIMIAVKQIQGSVDHIKSSIDGKNIVVFQLRPHCNCPKCDDVILRYQDLEENL